jgi:hypothetical protein
MKEKISDWNNDLIGSGVNHAEERVTFDASADAYTIVRTQNHGDFLLHSRDEMTKWDLYALPTADVDSYRIEMTASDRPPVIAVFQGTTVSIIAPNKRNDGTLDTLELIEIVPEDATHGPSHSGAGEVTVTLNNKTHVVYVGTTGCE